MRHSHPSAWRSGAVLRRRPRDCRRDGLGDALKGETPKGLSRPSRIRTRSHWGARARRSRKPANSRRYYPPHPAHARGSARAPRAPSSGTPEGPGRPVMAGPPGDSDPTVTAMPEPSGFSMGSNRGTFPWDGGRDFSEGFGIGGSPRLGVSEADCHRQTSIWSCDTRENEGTRREGSCCYVLVAG